MIYITRQVDFCAGHRLHNPNFSDKKNREVFGCCNNPNGHGHNYVLEVTLRGEVDPQTGMVMDLKALKALVQEEIVEKVDHKNLNKDVDFLSKVIPTAENIVGAFWKILEKKLPANCELYELRLWETDKNLAFCRRE